MDTCTLQVFSGSLFCLLWLQIRLHTWNILMKWCGRHTIIYAWTTSVRARPSRGKQHVIYSVSWFFLFCFAANMIALGTECLNPLLSCLSLLNDHRAGTQEIWIAFHFELHWIKFMICQGIQNSNPTLPDNTGKRLTSLEHSKTIRQVCVSPWQQLLQLWSYPWWSMCPRAVFQSMIRNAQRQVSVTRFESLEAFQKAMGGHWKVENFNPYNARLLSV